MALALFDLDETLDPLHDQPATLLACIHDSLASPQTCAVARDELVERRVQSPEIEGDFGREDRRHDVLRMSAGNHASETAIATRQQPDAL